MSTKGELRKNTQKRLVWSPAEESILLDLCEEKIEDLRGTRKNSHVYQEIAEKLREADFEASWSHVRTKIDNLTRKYKAERKKIGPTGVAPSEWEHFGKIHNFLGAFRCINAYDDIYESTDMSSLLEESVIQMDVASCSRVYGTDADRPPKKMKKADVNEELLQLARERHTMQVERGTQIEKLVTTLDNIATQNINFQKEFLEILRKRQNNLTNINM